MKPNKTYKSNDGFENFMCPFTQLFISQVENVGTHLGTYAVDINHYNGNSKRVPYYAPATVKCVNTIPSYGEATWQTVNKVHCPNGYFGIVTFETVHDESFGAYVGMVVKQGEQLGNMGMKPSPPCTGVHCHFEGCQSSNASMSYNKYNVYTYNAVETKIEDLCYMDDTNTLTNRNWKRTTDKKKEGWVNGEKGWWYQYTDGSYPKSCWQELYEYQGLKSDKGNKHWYYFDSKGYMCKSQWIKYNKKWYYVNKSGCMLIGLHKIGGEWYYFDKNGAMASNCKVDVSPYFDESGKMSK